MRVCFILMLFIVLWDDVTGATTYNVTEGEDFTAECLGQQTVQSYILCKNFCENILVDTKNTTETGRYSIRYNETSETVHVRIRTVTMSDAGQYQCWLNKDSEFKKSVEFFINITKASPSAKPPLTSPVTPLTSTVTSPVTPVTPPVRTTHLGYTGSNTTTTAPDSSSKTGAVLYVGLALAAAVYFSVALGIFCRNKKTNKPSVPRVNTESTGKPESDRVYEEIPEDTPATVHVSVSFSKDSALCSSDIYSLASAPAHPQTQDLGDTVLYSKVEFSGNSAPHSQTEALLYTPVQTENTLYSTVSERHQ